MSFVFIGALFSPRLRLAARLLAAKSQVAVLKHRIDQKRETKPRFSPAFRLLWRWQSKKWGCPPVDKEMQSLILKSAKDSGHYQSISRCNGVIAPSTHVNSSTTSPPHRMSLSPFTDCLMSRVRRMTQRLATSCDDTVHGPTTPTVEAVVSDSGGTPRGSHEILSALFRAIRVTETPKARNKTMTCAARILPLHGVEWIKERLFFPSPSKDSTTGRDRTGEDLSEEVDPVERHRRGKRRPDPPPWHDPIRRRQNRPVPDRTVEDIEGQR